jgi:predicted Rossmann-fold nucleotide-binding protein
MKTIACFGGSKCDDLCYATMEEIGCLLAEQGHTQINGAFGRALEASSKGADRTGGQVVGFTMMGILGNEYLSSLCDCRTAYQDVRRPGIGISDEIQYGVRLGNLLMADGFIIAAGPSTGTFVELMAVIAWVRTWKITKKIAILRSGEIKGWDSDMLRQLVSWGLLAEQYLGLILITEEAETAVNWVTA